MRRYLLLIALVILSGVSLRAQTPGFDPYGGSLLQTCPSWTNPYFGLQKVGNRWWFCTPYCPSGQCGKGNPNNSTSHVFFANAVGNILVNIVNDCNGKSNAATYKTKFALCGLPGQPACVGGQDPGTGKNWEWHTEKLLQAWGFNTIGQNSSINPWDTCSWGPYSSSTGYCNWPPVGGTNNPNPIRMPKILIFKDGSGSVINNFTLLPESVKDLENGENDVWSGKTPGGGNLGGGYRGSALLDTFDTKLGAYVATELASGTDPAHAALTANSPWALGVLADDSDFFYGAAAGPDFTADPGYGNQTNIAWSVMIAAPFQTMFRQSGLSAAFGPFLYATHTIVDSKAQANNIAGCSISNPCSLRDYLKDKYNTIGALNKAWAWAGCGTNCPQYTTFDSSCQTIGTVGDFTCPGPNGAAETVGTGDGSTLSFDHTIAHAPLSPNSVMLTYAGQPSAGDTPWYAYNNGTSDIPYLNDGGTNWGGLVSPAYPGATAAESGTTVTVTLNSLVAPTFPSTIVAGMNMTISGCTASGYNGTWTVTRTNPGASQFTFTAPGGLAASTTGCKATPWVLYPGAFVYSQATASAAAGAVTVTTGGVLPTQANGAKVKITGCNNSSFNGTWTVTGATTNTFTYTNGTLTATTGGCAVSFNPQVSESGTTVTVATAQFPAGLAVGDYITLNNCQLLNGNNYNQYNGPWQVTGVNSGAGTFTYTSDTSNLNPAFCTNLGTSIVNYSTGYSSVRFLNPPVNATAIALNYVYNGWMSGGTGILDEAGGNGKSAPVSVALNQKAGGTLGARTYYVEISCNWPPESAASNEQSIAVGANNLLTVTYPCGSVSGQTWNIYASTTAGTETLQASNIAANTNWTEPTSGLVTGTAPAYNSIAMIGSNGICIEGPNPDYPTYFSCSPPYTGQQGPQVNACGGAAQTPANCTFATDLDTWESQFSSEYHKVFKTALRTVSNLPFFGIDALGGGGMPSYSKFLQGAGAWDDAIFSGGPFYWTPSPSPTVAQTILRYQTQYTGDIPYMIFGYPNANADSAYYCKPYTFGTARFKSQAARGVGWANSINLGLNTPGYYGNYAMVGASFWDWSDFQNINQGLVSISENPYDGKGAVRAAGVDMFGVPTGGEDYDYGDVITPLSRGNTLWLQVLAGQGRLENNATTLTGSAH